MTITSVGEYLNWVQNVYHKTTQDPKKHLFFRGHSKSCYELKPSIFRDDRYKEKEVLLDFKQYAPVHSINYEIPRQIDRLLVDMQHYGVPTRLLDWTVAPLNALFFACNENLQDPAQVIVFNPWAYRPYVVGANEHAEVHQGHITARALLAAAWKPDAIGDYIKKSFNSLAFEKEDLNLPFPFVAIFSNPRILHQRGVFTIHGAVDHALDKFSEAVDHIERVDIPSTSKKSIMEELSQLYINDYSIYPDFQGMQACIKRHSSLFTVWNPLH